MATKFIDKNIKSKAGRKTIFTGYIDENGVLRNSPCKPTSWKNVEFLFTDSDGTSFFKCWDDEDATLYMGRRGTEFDEQ
jgi:hypothetical protein